MFFFVALFVALVGAKPAHVKYDQRQDGDLNVRADLENFVILIIPTGGSGDQANEEVAPNPPPPLPQQQSDVALAAAAADPFGLLSFLTRAVPSRMFKRKHGLRRKPLRHHQNDVNSLAPETQAFIESRTAPYHVDISRSKTNLAKLHPPIMIADQGRSENEKLLMSPSLALIRSSSSSSNANAVKKRDEELLQSSDGEVDDGRDREPKVLRLSKAILLSVPLKRNE